MRRLQVRRAVPDLLQIPHLALEHARQFLARPPVHGQKRAHGRHQNQLVQVARHGDRQGQMIERPERTGRPFGRAHGQKAQFDRRAEVDRRPPDQKVRLFLAQPFRARSDPFLQGVEQGRLGIKPDRLGSAVDGNVGNGAEDIGQAFGDLVAAGTVDVGQHDAGRRARHFSRHEAAADPFPLAAGFLFGAGAAQPEQCLEKTHF